MKFHKDIKNEGRDEDLFTLPELVAAFIVLLKHLSVEWNSRHM